MVVNLISHKQHRLLLAAQELRNFLIVRTQTVFSIHQKDHCVALVERGLDLAADFAFKYVVGTFDPSARIHEGKDTSAPFRTAVVAVARHAGHRIHNGFALLHQTVKKRRLAHVGATYNGD